MTTCVQYSTKFLPIQTISPRLSGLLRIFVWSWVLWLFVSGTGIAQNPVPYTCGSGDHFSVSATAGCAPLSVTVQNLDPTALHIEYYYDFKAGTSTFADGTENTSYTYDLPGEYTILQAASNGSGTTSCKKVVVTDATPPDFTVTACSNGEASLRMELNSVVKQYNSLEINWGEGSRQVVATDTLTGPVALRHLYDADGNYSVSVQGRYKSGSCAGSPARTLPVQIRRGNPPLPRITGLELASSESEVGIVHYQYSGSEETGIWVWTQPEGGAFSPYLPINADSRETTLVLQDGQVFTIKLVADYCGMKLESNEITTMLLKAESENEQNRISWNTYPQGKEFIRYELYKDGRSVRTFTDRTHTEWVDTEVTCGTKYTYRLRAVTAGEVYSQSATRSAIGKSETRPSDITGLYCTVQNDSVIHLAAEMPVTAYTDTYKLIIERGTTPEDAFRVLHIKEVDTPGPRREMYQDKTANAAQESYCYRFTYENACGNRSEPTPPVCSVRLQQQGNGLQWTSSSPFLTAVQSYEVLREEVPYEMLSSDETGFSPDQQTLTGMTSFRLRIRQQDGSLISESNVVNFSPEPQIFVPTAFTPNGDDVNNVFRAHGIFLQRFRLFVFNKWGEVLFSTDDPEKGWDGTVGGKKAPPGYYAYKLEVSDISGKPLVKTGSFLLVR